MRTQQVAVVTDIPETGWASYTYDKGRANLLQILQFRSLVAIPLHARGHSLGIMVWLSQQPRRYDHLDVPLAEEFSGRAALAIDNARLFQDAQHAIRAREDFLAIASHELRTPLTALVLQMSMLQRAIPTTADEDSTRHQITHLLGKANHSVDRLTLLVENLLDVSRISSGQLTLVCEEFDLAGLVRDVAHRFAPQSVKSGSLINIDANHPLVGRWDKLRMEQLLTNLLDNALKYGSGKPIAISVDSPSTNRVLIMIRDQGIGIAPPDLVRIFDRFERAVSLRNYGGLGLGLFLASRIARAHGGTVRVESTPGIGSTFTVDIPRYAETSAQRHSDVKTSSMSAVS